MSQKKGRLLSVKSFLSTKSLHPKNWTQSTYSKAPTSSNSWATPSCERTEPVCRLPLHTLYSKLEAVNLEHLLRIMVRLEWKMILSSEFSREMERALETNEGFVLFGRNDWINEQFRLTNDLRVIRRANKDKPATLFLLPLTEKISLPKSFPLVFTFNCVTANNIPNESKWINPSPLS